MGQAFTITPVSYEAFQEESEQLDKCKEWGLLSDKAVKLKPFFYKGGGSPVPCAIVGYVDAITAVIRIGDDKLHCIHPSYLKEMQASSYGVKNTASASEPAKSAQAQASSGAAAAGPTEADAAEQETILPAETTAMNVTEELPALTGQAASESSGDAAPPKAAAKKSKKEKLQLPEEKVAMTAKIQEFTTVPNHFSDNDDEVIIYGEVAILEPELALGEAWSSYSATLKKLELEVGDTITFEAKVVAKKLTKHPVPYKINNPSKLKKG